jgi:hypothetical protein
MQTLNLPEMSAETELVLRLARPGRSDLAEVEKIFLRGVAWEKAMEFARRHHLLTMFYPRLSELPEGLAPSGVLAEVKALFRLNLLRSARLGLLLETVHDTLARQGIEMIAMRGPLLAEMLYQPAPGMRVFSDLDILVHLQDFPTVYDRLAREGYQPAKPLTELERRWIVRGDRDLVFYMDKDILEVHWAVDEPGYCFPLKNEQYWEGMESHHLLDGNYLTFGSRMLFLNLCLHGVRHRWEKLAWVLDLAWFAHSQADFDWQGFWDWACTLGFRRAVAISMLMAELVGGAHFPEGVREVVWSETKALRLTRANLEGLFSGKTSHPRRSYQRALHDLVYDLQVRERWSAKLYMVVDRLFTPRQSDWGALRLPEGLYWLYYLLRPLRLVWSTLRR